MPSGPLPIIADAMVHTLMVFLHRFKARRVPPVAAAVAVAFYGCWKLLVIPHTLY